MGERESIAAYRQALRVLPRSLRYRALALSEGEQAVAEELRLRLGYPLSAVLPEGERSLGGAAAEREDLERLVELASQASLHAALPQLSQGFLTVEGGHRLGLCGMALTGEKGIEGFSGFTSAALRIAREYPGIGAELSEGLFEGEFFCNTLILAPPGAGKTTLLRDLIRSLSRGERRRPLRLGVVDQRGELSAPDSDGAAQMDLGPMTDVLLGAPKAQGLMLLLRSMSPQVLAMDEITAPEDIEALFACSGCGAALLATAHGRDRADLDRRPLYQGLAGAFQRLVTIRRVGERRVYCVEVLE